MAKRSKGKKGKGRGKIVIQVKSWEDYYSELAAMFEKFGDKAYRMIQDIDLLKWIEVQRQAKRDKSLSEKKLARLEEISFAWRFRKPFAPELVAACQAGFKNVSEARRAQNTAHAIGILKKIRSDLPETMKKLPLWTYSEVMDKEARQWLRKIRLAYEKDPSTIDNDTREQLMALRFDWKKPDSNDRAFARYGVALLEALEKTDSGKLSESFILEEGRSALGKWLRTCYEQKKNGTLPEIAGDFLESLGVDWTFNIEDIDEARWQRQFRNLLAFKEEFGHLAVPGNDPVWLPLSNWINFQRQMHREGRINKLRIKQLDEIDFSWSGLPELNIAWMEGYHKLVAFYEDRGHSLVPQDYEDDRFLGRWVSRQRTMMKEGKLSDAKKELLDKVEFEEEVRFWTTSLWDEKLEELKQYLKKKKRKRIPRSKRTTASLDSWLSIQRKRKREGKLNVEQINELEKLGILWDPQQTIRPSWHYHYRHLIRFKAINGHTRVTHFEDDPKLGHWVERQRKQYRTGRILDEKKKLLDEIGFEWVVKGKITLAWKRNYEELERYYLEHGHSNVPRQYPPNQKLAEYVAQQKQRFKKGYLKPQHIQLLKDVELPGIE